MKRTIPTALAVVVLLGASALAQAPSLRPGIRDRAGMFSPQAVKQAEQVLREVEEVGRWQVLIETRDRFGEQSAREVAVDNARKANLRGLSIAISKNEHKLDIELSESIRPAFTPRELELVKEAFTRAFRKGENDEGLLDAVAEIRRASLKVGVRDQAKLFSPEAVKEADSILEAVRRKTHWGTIIETVDTLGGKSLRDTAIEKARSAQVHGLYILIAKKEHKIYAQPSESAKKVFPSEKARSIENIMSAAFKKNEFDTGLHDAVVAIRQETASSAASQPEPTALAPKVGTSDADVPRVPAPIDPGVVKSEGVTSTMILLGGGALLLVLWLLFRRSRSSQPQMMPPQEFTGGGSAPRPAPGAGYPPTSRPGVPPGYAPQPGPAPGYGYPPPPPGYAQGGYGAPMPPQQSGGGGFFTGALGGAAGAIAGNILYDKFGRPHEPQAPVHSQGGNFPHQSDHPLDPNANLGSEPPLEQYDPNTGVGADWGSSNSEGTVPEVDQSGVGGDWSGGTEEPDETGGDWSGGTEEPTETGGDWSGGTEAPDETGGDWGGGTEEPTESGEDWGGGSDDDGGGDVGSEEQGGSW
ncbi:TPM domain-containing protein [Singulisphaera sp. Ch08]|uniref:TPM domain-containing protein n=1 Tax=Singulisphaera sp. Ch08 TaxID=3120278 RepID=A0AAU7CSI0_9BACT